MKQFDLDSKLKRFNQIHLTEHESTESYQQIISRVNTRRGRKNMAFTLKRTATTFATVVVLIAAGWFLYDMLNQSTNEQLGDETPAVTDDDRDNEEMNDDGDNQVVEDDGDNQEVDDDRDNEERDDDSNNDEVADDNDKQEEEDKDITPVETADNCSESNVEATSNSLVVYFECQEYEEHPYPFKEVLRDIDSGGTLESKIEYAIQEVIKGPTNEEMENGFHSIFNDETAGLLNGIELQDSGYLIVDFIDFSQIIPNASTAAGSLAMMESLNRTIAQFDEVELVEYQFDGSCDQFYGWIQVGSCMSHDMNEYREN